MYFAQKAGDEPESLPAPGSDGALPPWKLATDQFLADSEQHLNIG